MVRRVNPYEESGRRIKAARILAGLRNKEALAAHLNQPNMGATKIGQMEAGSKPLHDYERDFIADKLGLPRSFFTAPLERLGDVDPSPRERHAALADDALAAPGPAIPETPPQTIPQDRQSERKRSAG